MAAGDALNAVQFTAPAKPKADRVMAYRFPDAGVTACPGCYKKQPAEPGEAVKVMRRSDYDSDDLEVCTAGCGRTILGAEHTRRDA